MSGIPNRIRNEGNTFFLRKKRFQKTPAGELKIANYYLLVWLLYYATGEKQSKNLIVWDNGSIQLLFLNFLIQMG